MTIRKGHLTHYTKGGKLKRGRPPKDEESAHVTRQRERAALGVRENERIIEARYPVCKCPPNRCIPAGSPTLGHDSCRQCGYPFRR